MHPDHVAIGTPELGVEIDHRLYVVGAGRKIGESFERRAKVTGVDHRRLPRGQTLHVSAKERNTGPANLETGLTVIGPGNHHKDTPGDRLRDHAGGNGNLETERRVDRLRIQRLHRSTGQGDHCPNQAKTDSRHRGLHS